VIVIDRAIAYETRLANRIVIPTEKTATITEFLNGVITFPVSMSVLKLLRFQCFGKANGFVYISTSSLKVPKTTIELGTKTAAANNVNMVFLKIL
jgi:hypothetical protein